MAALDATAQELIGIAAAVAGHCRPCLEYHLAEARGLGVSDDQIREAVKLAEAISRSGDRRMHEFAEGDQGRTGGR